MMMLAAWFILIAMLVLLIIANFVFQIIVANKLHDSGLKRFFGYIRGTRTFIRGWRFADELKIRDTMVIWSAIVGVMVVWVIAIVFFAAMMDSNEPAVSSSESNQTFVHSVTTSDETVCNITFPESGPAYMGNIPVEGYVTINPSNLDYWELKIYPEGQPNNATTLSEPSSIPFPQGEMGSINTEKFEPGKYTIQLRAVQKYSSDTTEYHCLDQITVELR